MLRRSTSNNLGTIATSNGSLIPRVKQSQTEDGVFPLITNTSDLTAEEVLRAYKRQPIIEKRFSQLETTDFAVAPIYLKSVSRIQALFCVYFFSLMLQSLLEREPPRDAARRDRVTAALSRRTTLRKPTTRRIIDVFEPVQRHRLQAANQTQTLTTELTTLQKSILKLLGINSENYAH